MRLRQLSLSLLLAGLAFGASVAQPSSPQLSARMAPADSLPSQRYTDRLLLEGAIASAPLVGVGLLQSLQNDHVRQLRYGYSPHFRHHYDDYLQFAPLVAQVGLRLGGVEGASSSLWQTFTADLLASASMMAITSAIKYTARVERPDGSTRNSFPSGHTAMAFTAATLLAQEYGGRYPWISVAGYGIASAVGVGRVLNNRHWIGDVVTGAGLGVLSGHLGYWMADRLFGGSRRRLQRTLAFAPSSLQLYVPVSLTTSRRVGAGGWSLWGRQLGLGVHYTPKAWPLFLMGEASLDFYYPLPKSDFIVPGFPEYRSLTFALGVGRSQHLWRELALEGALYGTLSLGVNGTEEPPLPQGVYLRGRHSAWGVGATLAPSWRLTRRIGLRLPFSLRYTPLELRLEGVEPTPLSLARLYYGLGTALTIYL